MNLTLTPFRMGDLFTRSLALYQAHFIPLILLVLVFLIPPWIMGILNWTGLEFVFLFLIERLLEAAITLGLLAMTVRPIFPVTGILHSFFSPGVLGAINIGFLQFTIFFFGLLSALILPLPLNILMMAFWLGSVFMFSLAQQVYMVEGLRGMHALARSYQIIRPYLAKAFWIIMFIKFLQIILPGMIAFLFLPEINLTLADTPEQIKDQLVEFLKKPQSQQVMRWSQYAAILLFHPFAAIALSLLYLNFLHLQFGIDLSRLSTNAWQSLRYPDKDSSLPTEPTSPSTESPNASEQKDSPLANSEEKETPTPSALPANPSGPNNEKSKPS